MNSKYLITSLQRSICYLIYCMLQLLISTMLLIYVKNVLYCIGNHGQIKSLENPIVIILEGLLTLTICTDIALKAILEGREFLAGPWNVLDVCALLSIMLCMRLQYEVYYDEIFGISLISMRYLSLSVRLIVLLKQSYFVQMMQQQRDILIFKRSRNHDSSILDISSEILNDSRFVETMNLVNE